MRMDDERLDLNCEEATIALARSPGADDPYVALRTWRVEPRGDCKVSTASCPAFPRADFFWHPAPANNAIQAQQPTFPKGWIGLRGQSPNTPRFFLVAVEQISTGERAPAPAKTVVLQRHAVAGLELCWIPQKGAPGNVRTVVVVAAAPPRTWTVSSPVPVPVAGGKVTMQVNSPSLSFYWKGAELYTRNARYSDNTTFVWDGRDLAQAQIDSWPPRGDSTGTLELK